MEETTLISRRKFLGYVGASAAAIAVASTGLGALSGKAQAAMSPGRLFMLNTNKVSDQFDPIQPSAADELVLPPGFKYDVIAAYGDTINSKGDTFGFNNEYTSFFPIDDSNVNGLLWVNHASVDSLWVQGSKKSGQYTPSQKKQMLYNQGASVLAVYRGQDGAWQLDKESRSARRISGLDEIELAGPARGSQALYGATKVMGTFGNSGGTRTLWNTVLSCEGLTEETCGEMGLALTHYGWVIEADPLDPSFKVRKQTALGRFAHGSASMGLSKDGRVVVYLGSLQASSCLYKFISKNTFNASRGSANSDLLNEGTLYAAQLETGTWIALTLDAVKEAMNGLLFQVPNSLPYVKEELIALFQEPSDVYTHAHEAALILGATPVDRPADLQLSSDNTLYVAHTQQPAHGNLHGHVTRIDELDGDAGSITFEFELFASGGRQSRFSSPGNLSLDNNGNVWVLSSIAPQQLNLGAWKSFQNNGIFAIGSDKLGQGTIGQFASAPVGARFCGPELTKDEQTMFVSVQHPGAGSTDADKPASSWPHRSADKAPRPAVTAISGFHR